MYGEKEGRMHIVILRMRGRTLELYIPVVKQMLLILRIKIVALPLEKLLSLLRIQFFTMYRRLGNLSIAVASRLILGSVGERMLGLLL